MFFKKFFKKRYTLENNLLVSGSTRGSTTWLAEALNANDEFRIIFEPFTPWQVPEWKITGKQKRYLAPKDKSPHKDLVRKLLLGYVHNKWVDRLKRSNQHSNKVLVKETRVSAMLGWIQHNFPELKIIIIVRDPYSVAFSNAERNWKDAVSDLYLEQEQLVKDNLKSEQVRKLESADTLFQKSIGMWVIETYLALKYVERNNQSTGVFYENLVRDPTNELRRLYEFFGSSFDESSLKKATQRSAMAGEETVTDAQSKNFGRRWETKITEADKQYADELIEVMGLSSLYPERNQPGYSQPLDLVI